MPTVYQFHRSRILALFRCNNPLSGSVSYQLIKVQKNEELEVLVRDVVPVDLMAIFELKNAETTIDKNAEFRREVISFVEIAFDSRRSNQIFLNFPKHNLSKLRKLLKPFHQYEARAHMAPNKAERNPIVELQRFEPKLTAILEPLFV